jgi:hypothetical protein
MAVFSFLVGQCRGFLLYQYDIKLALMVRSTTKTVCRNRIHDSIPRPVRPRNIVTCRQAFEAHGHTAATSPHVSFDEMTLEKWQQPNSVLLERRGLTPALCRRSRALSGRMKPKPPPKRLWRASMPKLQSAGAVSTNALLAHFAHILPSLQGIIAAIALYLSNTF